MHLWVYILIHLFQIISKHGSSFTPAGKREQAADWELLPSSWGQRQTWPHYTGRYHSRHWCSWSRDLRRISVHSHHTGRERHSSSRTLSPVVNLQEERTGFYLGAGDDQNGFKLKFANNLKIILFLAPFNYFSYTDVCVNVHRRL